MIAALIRLAEAIRHDTGTAANPVAWVTVPDRAFHAFAAALREDRRYAYRLVSRGDQARTLILTTCAGDVAVQSEDTP